MSRHASSPPLSSRRRVQIERLILGDFRNYEQLDVQPAPGINVLFGRNAQGKTNLLESVLLLSLGKSPRTSRDVELIRRGETRAAVTADLVKRDSSGRLQMLLNADGPKRILWNDAPLRPRDALGILNAVSFFPDDLYLVKGGPGERRRLLDVLLCQADARYRRHLSALQRILRHRNTQLKALQGRFDGGDLLHVWTEQLRAEAVPLLVRRAEAVRRLGEHAAQLHANITDGDENLQLVYKPFFAADDAPASPDWEDAAAMDTLFRQAAAGAERDELRRGVSLIGPQRDDVRFIIGGVDARTFASQGQQRTAVLALKLAELEFLWEETAENPVLLLDDVLSELDERRRAFLLASVADNVQTFVTAVQAEPLPPALVERARVFYVKQGTVTLA